MVIRMERVRRHNPVILCTIPVGALPGNPLFCGTNRIKSDLAPSTLALNAIKYQSQSSLAALNLHAPSPPPPSSPLTLHYAGVNQGTGHGVEKRTAKLLSRHWSIFPPLVPDKTNPVPTSPRINAIFLKSHRQIPIFVRWLCHLLLPP